MTSIPAALVDTDVFSVVMVRHHSPDPRSVGWREALRGRRVVIAFQTRAEVLAGARIDRWGDRRMQALLRQLDTTPTIHSDEAVADSYAALTATCRTIGHALQQREHNGDRWIAACAMAHGLPLLAGDRIYEGVPGLQLLA